MILQLDGDVLACQIAFALNNVSNPESLVNHITNKTIQKYFNKAKEMGKINEMHIYQSPLDRSNFRFDVSDDYKANRTGEKPRYFHEVRECLTQVHGAVTAVGMEADDILSIKAWEAYCKGTLIYTVTIDKDNRVHPGLHDEMSDHPVYEVHWPGSLIVYRTKSGTKVFGTGLKWFYYQLLVGDKIDGVPGIMKSMDAFHMINNLTGDFSYWMKGVAESYGISDEEITKRGQLLWLKRTKDEPLWSLDSSFETPLKQK